MNDGITDEFVRAALGKTGEQPVPGNRRKRWGMVRQLNGTNQRVATFIATDVFDLPTPLAVSLTFSLDGQVFSPVVPNIGNNSVVVDLIRGIDPQSSPVTDRYELETGDRQEFCAVIAQSLQVVCRLDGEPPLASGLYVAVVVAPVSSLDCEQIVPVPPTPTGYSTTLATRYPALTAPTYSLLAEPTRALIVVANQSTANLFFNLGSGVNITPGSEFATVVLPGNASAGFSAANYRGPVEFRFDADDSSGYALVTRGLYT